MERQSSFLAELLKITAEVLLVCLLPYLAVIGAYYICLLIGISFQWTVIIMMFSGLFVSAYFIVKILTNLWNSRK